MTIEQVIEQAKSVSEIRNKLELWKRPFSVDYRVIAEEWEPTTHKVMKEQYRKKKKVKVPTDRRDEYGQIIYATKYIDVCRVAVPIQKVLTERGVGFLFSTPVDYKTNGDIDKKSQQLVDAIADVMSANKMEYFDKKLARAVYRAREAAELWYYVTDENGHPTDEIKVKLLSPIYGDKLLPHFDEYDRLDGFCREYKTTDFYGKKINHIDIYTSQYVYRWESSDDANYVMANPQPHGFDRLPIVYYRQEETEWTCVQPLIERLETLLSNWGDTNDYFGSPSYFIKGDLKGFADKGEQGRIYQSSGDADMRVLSWDSSPTSIQLEMATLQNTIFSMTQIPDISFETMKQLGNNTSGAAIRLMFTDPHMKARMKIEMFGEMFVRRYNILKAAVGALNGYPQSVIDKVKVTPKFTPYIPTNETEQLNMAISSRQSGISSLETALRNNPIVDNPNRELKLIQEEQMQAQMMSAFEPTE